MLSKLFGLNFEIALLIMMAALFWFLAVGEEIEILLSELLELFMSTVHFLKIAVDLFFKRTRV